MNTTDLIEHFEYVTKFKNPKFYADPGPLNLEEISLIVAGLNLLRRQEQRDAEFRRANEFFLKVHNA